MGELKDNEKSKVLGFSIWPINHLVGIFSLEKATPKTNLRVSYKVKPTHTSVKDWIQALFKVIPFWTLTLICNYFYSIEQQMQESDQAIKKFMSGDTDLKHHGWILKIAARDMLVSFTCCVAW